MKQMQDLESSKDIIIISGPSGSGKSSLCKELFRHIPNLYFSVSSTTRQKRYGEVNGVHYNFISQDEFQKGIDNSLFLEYEKVHDNYYGTERSQVENALKSNKVVVFDIDTRGQKSIKTFYPNATSIFITTPNAEILRDRLTLRGTDTTEVIEKRLAGAFVELREIGAFDFVIINDDFITAFEGLSSIVKSCFFKNTNEIASDIMKKW